MIVEPAIRKVIHVDMDAFFASVEQRDDPSLRGRPVAVGHGASRGVVAAASYEARKFGVRSALPSITAMRRCPELVFVPPSFEVYRAVSAQIHAIFAEFTDLIQPLSLDEAYLDVTANRRELPTAWLTAKAIRARILEETGLTASAGISYNKFLAKLASDHRKPNGQVRGHARHGPSLGRDTAGLTLPRRRPGHRRQDEAARHRDRRRPPLPNRSRSCSSISAVRPNGITRSRAARTTGRSIQTGCASRRDPRPRSART